MLADSCFSYVDDEKFVFSLTWLERELEKIKSNIFLKKSGRGKFCFYYSRRSYSQYNEARYLSPEQVQRALLIELLKSKQSSSTMKQSAYILKESLIDRRAYV